MSWADPCLVKKLWLIHTIFECSVLLAVVFFLVASFVWFFMFFSIFFFLSYRRENMSGLYFSSNQTKLVQKKSKGKLSIEMNLKKKITDGKIKSVVKTCRKVKWNKIEVNFVGVMYIIWKLYDWNSSKICMQFQIWGKCEADHSQT